MRTTPPSRSSGFTMLEVLITAVILGAVMSGTWAASLTAKTKSVLSEDSPVAPMLAREIHALSLALPKEPAGATGATNGSSLDALDRLVGASFSPPIRADGTALADFGGWTQQVTLDVYDLDDLSTPCGDDPALGIAEGAAKIYRVAVTVLEDGESAGTFRRWVAP